MAREIVMGPADPYKGTIYTPELISPEMGWNLAQWRFWSTGDGVAYFNAMGVVIDSAEDRSASLSSMLGHPDGNLDGTMLNDVEPMSSRPPEVTALRASVTDAIGLGQYLLGHQHPDFPTSWAEIGIPRVSGHLGRMAIKATLALNRRTQKSIKEIDQMFEVDIKDIFDSATAYAWQYVDAFESDLAVFAVVRMSSLPRAAKKQLGLYKQFEKWERRLENTAGIIKPDQKLQARRVIFHDILSVARNLTTKPNMYSNTEQIAALVKVVKQHDVFKEDTDSVIAELTEIVNIFTHQSTMNSIEQQLRNKD